VGLVKRFPRHQGWRSLLSPTEDKIALDGVTLQVQPGEIFGLLGPNGAGKTTLVKTLSTLLLPSEGEVRVCGLEVVKQSLAVRARIGLVYGDERSFFWRLSAFENLMFYSALYGFPRSSARVVVESLLDFVDLARDAHVRMSQFSSGMRQRVSIARGLLNDPEVLILDEPTRSLDPIAAADLRSLIRNRVADSRRTVLITTNVMAEAEQLCDRVAFLSRGRIELSGSVDRLQKLLRPDERHVLKVSHVDYHRLRTLHSIPGVISVEPMAPCDAAIIEVSVVVERQSAAIPAVIRQLVDWGGDVWSISAQELSLEEMFAIAVNGNRVKEVVA
jgi:ABC-2 type transport system ATP-binding protein